MLGAGLRGGASFVAQCNREIYIYPVCNGIIPCDAVIMQMILLYVLHVSWGTFSYWGAEKGIVMTNMKNAFSCNGELCRTD